MEDLFAKAIKLLAARSIYNKTDQQIDTELSNLLSFAFSHPEIKPNSAKLLRFVEELDTTQFDVIPRVVQQLRAEYLSRSYRTHLGALHEMLMATPGSASGDFKQVKEVQQNYIQTLKKVNTVVCEKNLRLLGLQQAKLRLQEVQQIHAQLKTAAAMLSQQQASKTVLEQKYFHQEFSKLAKKLKVKFLQDYELGQSAIDLHNTMLISDMKFQIQQSENLQRHKHLFVKCFGARQFYETFYAACIEFIEQQYHISSQIPAQDLNELDVFELIIDLTKFLTLLHRQLLEETLDAPMQQIQMSYGQEMSAGPLSSSNNPDNALKPQAFGMLLVGGALKLEEICMKFFRRVSQFFSSQEMLSVHTMARALLLLTKTSIQVEQFFYTLQEFQTPELKVDLRRVALATQTIYKQIAAVIKTSVQHFRTRLRGKFIVNKNSFDQWIAIQYSNAQFQQMEMAELRETTPEIDVDFILHQLLQLDKLRRRRAEAEADLFVAFTYAYAYNEDMKTQLELIRKDPNFVWMQKQRVLEIKNIKIIPPHFYQTLLYCNQFMSFLQRYDPDFDASLIVGSTVNCVTEMICPPVLPKKVLNSPAITRPFILDECLFISQIKLVSIFAELLEYEKTMAEYYLKVNYSDVLQRFLGPVINKILGYQVNFKCAFRSVLEYQTTSTVTSGSKVLFDNLLYFSRIITPFPRIETLTLKCIIEQLELNLIDHYSFITWSPDVYETVLFELDYLKSSIFGLFHLQSLTPVNRFVELYGAHADGYIKFKEDFYDLFNPIGFKEIMMRMATQGIYREEALRIVTGAGYQ